MTRDVGTRIPRRMKPALDSALDALGGIGNALRLVRAAPHMAQAIRDIAECGYMNTLPEEIQEPIKVAIDILDGGDGVIYR